MEISSSLIVSYVFIMVVYGLISSQTYINIVL